MDIQSPTNEEKEYNYYKDNYIISTRAKSFNPYKIITFDTESLRFKRKNGEIHKFFNIDFYDGTEHYYSENIADVIPLIKKIQQKYNWIFSDATIRI